MSELLITEQKPDKAKSNVPEYKCSYQNWILLKNYFLRVKILKYYNLHGLGKKLQR